MTSVLDPSAVITKSHPLLPFRTHSYWLRKGNNADQLSRKSAKKDEYDDLLDGLLSKEEKKSNKRKDNIQPYSSTYLDPPNNMFDMKKT